MTKIISYAGTKGGTGKTTLLLHMMHSICASHDSVLLIDLDPQGTLSRFIHTSKTRPAHTALSIFTRDASINDMICRISKHLSVIYSNSNILDIFHTMGDEDNKESLLIDWLNQNHHQIANYDYILIDLPPEINNVTLNTLVASDTIIAPVLPDRYGAQSATYFDSLYTDIKTKLISSVTQQPLVTANLLFVMNNFDPENMMVEQYDELIRTNSYASGTVYKDYLPANDFYNKQLTKKKIALDILPTVIVEDLIDFVTCHS